jgi:hypothetical protein
MTYEDFMKVIEKYKAMKKKWRNPLTKKDSKNIIYPKVDIRRVRDMPEYIRKYYGLTNENIAKMVYINNGYTLQDIIGSFRTVAYFYL